MAAAFREYVAAQHPGRPRGRGHRRCPRSGPATRRSTRRPCRPGDGRCSGRSAARCCSPRRAAAARRRTWPRSWTRRWCSSRSASTRDRIHAPNESGGYVPAPARGRGVGVPVGRASRRGPEVTPLDSLALSRGTVDRLTEKRTDRGVAGRGVGRPGHPRARRLRRPGAGPDRRRAGRAGLRAAGPGARTAPGSCSARTPTAPSTSGSRGPAARRTRRGAAPPRYARSARCSATATRACSRTRWRWPTGTTRTPTARSTAPPRCVGPGGHFTVCPKDGTEHFPRTDPAVIMLVTDPDDRCLLARNAAWPGRRVSILAGFVDPGESAEQAVIREVAEETQIKVTNVRYVGSQPWPMPRSLMLGFRADAPAGQDIVVDREEIAEAYWFSRDELAGRDQVPRDRAAAAGVDRPADHRAVVRRPAALHLVRSPVTATATPAHQLGGQHCVRRAGLRTARLRSASCRRSWRAPARSGCWAPATPSTTWPTRPAPRSAWPGCRRRWRSTRPPRWSGWRRA